MLRTTLPVWLFLITSLASCSLTGQIIYDNGAGGIKGINSGFISDTKLNSSAADNFKLLGSHVVKQIEWTGYYGKFAPDPAVDDFVVDIYLTDQNAPSKLIRRNLIGDNLKRINTGVSIDGFSVFNYTAEIEDFEVSEFNSFWLDIHNNTALDKNFWYWGMITDDGDSLFSQDQGGSWDKGGHRMDFRLSGVNAVPEPSSAIFVGTLLFGLGLLRRNRHERGSEVALWSTIYWLTGSIKYS